MNGSHINIEIEQNRVANQIIYALKTDHGSLYASFGVIDRWFGITNLDVESDYRRRGIARALLERSVELAYEVDARLIYAAITSEAAVHAFRSVFGEEAVTSLGVRSGLWLTLDS